MAGVSFTKIPTSANQIAAVFTDTPPRRATPLVVPSLANQTGPPQLHNGMQW